MRLLSRWLVLPACVVLLCCATAPKEGGAARSAAAEPSFSEEPERSEGGSDLSTLPARYPQAEWVPIHAPLLSMRLLAKVLVNGVPAVATLDTGAMSTVMSVPVALKLGVLGQYTPSGEKVRALDAHGDTLEGERLPLGEVAIGAHRWVDTRVTVIGQQPDLFLIGADLLQDTDLYVAGDEGLVGIFEAGEAPTEGADHTVTLERGERQLRVKASARSGKGRASFPLIVDTGASVTTVPAYVGVTEGLPADLSFESSTLAVGGEVATRGRFILDPLLLGPEEQPAGRVLAMSSAMEKGEGAGLLGNDVMMRHHTIISFQRGKMWLRELGLRPSSRRTGPGGATCKGEDGDEVSCVRVALRAPEENVVMPSDSMTSHCLQIDVGEAYAGRTVELAITARGQDGQELFSGGALRAYVSVAQEGLHGCFTLWRQLERLGLDETATLSLRWVRTEGIVWPCDPSRTQCLSFTGPLARLEVR